MLNKLIELVGREGVLTDEPMARHTTFRVGGPADFFVMPGSAVEACGVIALCRAEKIPFMVMGNGSNLLVGDRGYRGVIIQLLDRFQDIAVDGILVRAQAGALLSAVARRAYKNELTGMEFAAGIPGTIGGAMMMNAGAYGGEMKDIVREVKVLDESGAICRFSRDDMAFGYRDSVIAHRDLTVLEITLSLRGGKAEEIKVLMDDLAFRRSSKQPLEYPSAGSTFKRPEGYFAGALIEQAGLKGYRHGGAMVSDKHCGFVINTGGASAADIRELIDHVRRVVYDQSGVMLTPEVRFTGEF